MENEDIQREEERHTQRAKLPLIHFVCGTKRMRAITNIRYPTTYVCNRIYAIVSEIFPLPKPK